MTGFQIAPAALTDAPALLSLQRLAFQSEAELYQDWSIPPLVQTLPELEAEFPAYLTLKALEAGELVGAVRGSSRDGVCHVGRLMVRPDRQRRGVGSSLLAQLESRFPAARRFELFTGSRSAGNLRLYASVGYRVFQSRLLPSGVELLFLEKTRLSDE